MYNASDTIANRAMASLRELEITPTPTNYAIWFEYHAGQSLRLKRTIDVLISNRAVFDDETMQDLHSTFFTAAKEAQAVRRTSTRVLETLEEIVGLADLAQQDAHEFGAALRGFAGKNLGESLENLKQLIEDLVVESQGMAGRSEFVGLRMRESANKIEALERNLETAIRASAVDGLTGVSNRKAFDATLRKNAADAMNSGDDLALLMIDIDRFKVVNDTWGHQIGDMVLRYLAEMLQKAVRGGDCVARYGGEEFAVILPRTDIRGAVNVAENIRAALGRDPLLLDLDPPFRPITVSVGAACYEPGDPLDDWVGRADAALYRAKREGRNRVQSDGSES